MFVQLIDFFFTRKTPGFFCLFSYLCSPKTSHYMIISVSSKGILRSPNNRFPQGQPCALNVHCLTLQTLLRGQGRVVRNCLSGARKQTKPLSSSFGNTWSFISMLLLQEMHWAEKSCGWIETSILGSFPELAKLSPQRLDNTSVNNLKQEPTTINNYSHIVVTN